MEKNNIVFIITTNEMYLRYEFKLIPELKLSEDLNLWSGETEEYFRLYNYIAFIKAEISITSSSYYDPGNPQGSIHFCC